MLVSISKMLTADDKRMKSFVAANPELVDVMESRGDDQEE